MNCPAPEDTGEFDDEDDIPEFEIDIGGPTKAEFYAVLKEVKNKSAGGVYSSLRF